MCTLSSTDVTQLNGMKWCCPDLSFLSLMESLPCMWSTTANWPFSEHTTGMLFLILLASIIGRRVPGAPSVPGRPSAVLGAQRLSAQAHRHFRHTILLPMCQGASWLGHPA